MCRFPMGEKKKRGKKRKENRLRDTQIVEKMFTAHVGRYQAHGGVLTFGVNKPTIG